jgi:hypothetical protein
MFVLHSKHKPPQLVAGIALLSFPLTDSENGHLLKSIIFWVLQPAYFSVQVSGRYSRILVDFCRITSSYSALHRILRIAACLEKYVSAV